MAAFPSLTAQELHWQSLVDRDVYQTLAKEGPMTLGTLSNQVNMPRIPLFRVLSRLMVRKLVEEIPRARTPQDRPLILYGVT
ncbi:MAG: helix-turn-helix domain-containing protein [Candidatus Hodarchaeales archaeon]